MQAFQKLIDIAKKLRDKKHGCPWDQKQTIKSMLPHLQSEIKEVAAAVKKQDWKNLEEELGDVLLNVAMISQIAAEEKKFTMAGVLRCVNRKVKERHTWVFGKDRSKVKTAEQALAIWTANKRKEKR